MVDVDETVLDEVVEDIKAQATRTSLPQQLNVVFSHEVLSSLVSFLMNSFNGSALKSHESVLEGKLNERLFHQALTIVDDPLSDGMGRFSFDDEGVVAAPITLVKDGVLKAYLFDMVTNALYPHYDGKGRAYRGSYASPPVPSTSNVIIDVKPVNRHLFDQPYVLIKEISGLHTSNPVTGDLALSVPLAFLVDRGEKRGLSPFSISTNIFKLFNQIIAADDDARWFDSLKAPTIMFSGVDVST